MTTTAEQRNLARKLALDKGVELGERGIAMVASLIGDLADSRADLAAANERTRAAEAEAGEWAARAAVANAEGRRSGLIYAADLARHRKDHASHKGGCCQVLLDHADECEGAATEAAAPTASVPVVAAKETCRLCRGSGLYVRPSPTTTFAPALDCPECRDERRAAATPPKETR